MIENIILDYGHGGIDKNGNYTTAPKKMFKFSNGITAYEGVINRQIGGLLEMYLNWSKPELNIITTIKAYDSRDISLSQRVRVANAYPKNKTIFISIHSNASENHMGRGFEIFTTIGKTLSDSLATKIGESVKTYYDRINLKLRFDFDSDGDLDKEQDFYVLRKTKCPAVLLECLFFDNWKDFEYLNKVEFQKELAWHIYLGIIDFINNENQNHI